MRAGFAKESRSPRSRSASRARVAARAASAEAGRIAEFLGEIVGTPFPDQESAALRAARQDAQLMGEQMRRAFENFVDAESEEHPVLLVLEDLHWGDLPTVQFVDVTLRSLHHRAFLVLALARPEVHELFPKLWIDRRMQEIRLLPLSRKASSRLVTQVLGESVSKELVARVAAQADGNAFYLEELIRAVADAKDRGEASDLALPETVLTMVQARLERLPKDARRLLRAASLFGEVFWESGIAALLGGELSPSVIDRRLDELSAREIIVRRPSSRFAGEKELMFRNALLREGAYAMLTEGDQELGHRLAGLWLSAHGEHDAMLLAQHFERGRSPRARCGRTSAQRSWRSRRMTLPGLDRARRGKACGAAGEDLGALLLVQAEAHLWRGELALAEEHATLAAGLLAPGAAAWFHAVRHAAIAAGKLGAVERCKPGSTTPRPSAPARAPSALSSTASAGARST